MSVAVLALAAGAYFFLRQSPSERKVIATTPATAVYLSATGTKYHRSHCRTLRRTRTPVSVADAAQMGYAPCRVCRPPAPGKK